MGATADSLSSADGKLDPRTFSYRYNSAIVLKETIILYRKIAVLYRRVSVSNPSRDRHPEKVRDSKNTHPAQRCRDCTGLPV